MGDILEKIFAVLLIVILMFFFPLLDAFERIDDLSYMSVYAATVKFVDAVRTTGHITPEMYTEYIQKLNATGNKYKVEMSHRRSMYYPFPESGDDGIVAEGHGHILLDEEFNNEQILYKMGYYEYDETNNSLQEKTPTKDYANFAVGDYFYVAVKNTTPTPATVIKRVIYGSNVTDLSIMVPYGGLIQNDSNRELVEIASSPSNPSGGGVTNPVQPWDPAEPPEVEEPEVVGVNLASVANVGDYVQYIPDGPTSYTILSSNSGTSENQIISRRDINWRVLKVEGDTVTLISEQPIDNIGLKGLKGYLNGPTILNETYRNLYSGSRGQARSLNIEDVNRLMGYVQKVAVYTHESGNVEEVAYGKTIYLAHKAIGADCELPHGGELRDYPLTDYGYNGSAYRANNEAAYNLLFETNQIYWLASSCIGAIYKGDDRADFDIRLIAGTSVMAENLYYSNNAENNRTGAFYHLGRPIVVLNSGIQTIGGDGTSASNAWVLK